MLSHRYLKAALAILLLCLLLLLALWWMSERHGRDAMEPQAPPASRTLPTSTAVPSQDPRSAPVAADTEKSIVEIQSETSAAVDGAVSISGNVSDQAGVLEGAVVQLRQPLGEDAPLDATPPTIASAKSDESGNYRLENVAAGAYAILCYRPGTHATVWRWIEIAPAIDESGEDFVLEAGGTIWVLARDDADAPVAEVEITLTRLLDEKSKIGVESHTLRSNAEGVAEFNGVANEPHAVTYIVPEGYSGRQVIGDFWRPGFTVNIQLTRGLTLRGRVVDAAGAPVRAFRISSRFGRDQRLGIDNSRDIETADGAFEWKGASTLSATIEIDSPAHARTTLLLPDLEGKMEHDFGDIVLGAGAKVDGLVVDSIGAPVAGAHVRALPMKATRILTAPGTVLDGERSATSDESGAFTIANLSSDRYVIFAAMPWGASPRQMLVMATRSSQSGLLLVIERHGTITGTVRGAGHAAQADVRVSLFGVLGSGSDTTFRNETTDDDGVYRFERLTSGDYQVSPQSSESAHQGNTSAFSMRTQRVKLGLEETLVVDFAGFDACRVHGVVSVPGEFKGLRMIQFAGEATSYPAALGDDGAYEIKELPVGAYKVAMREIPLGEIVVPASAEARFDFAVALARVSGRVRASDETPVPTAVVSLQPIAGLYTGSAFNQTFAVAADQAFSFLMAPGDYMAMARTPDGGASPEIRLELNLDGRSELEFVIQKGGSIEVTIASSESLTASEVIVACTSALGVVLQQVALEPGESTARMDGLPPGPCFISAITETHGVATESIDLSDGGLHTATLRLGGALGHARIRVTKAGQPVSYATARITDSQGAAVLQIFYDRLTDKVQPQGEAGCLTGLLLPGSYRVRARSGEFESEPQPFQITAGQRTEVVIELP